MSLGYWGIVAGLGALLGAFFLCMELLYSNARNTGKDNAEPPAKPNHEGRPSGTKHAA